MAYLCASFAPNLWTDCLSYYVEVIDMPTDEEFRREWHLRALRRSLENDPNTLYRLDNELSGRVSTYDRFQQAKKDFFEGFGDLVFETVLPGTIYEGYQHAKDFIDPANLRWRYLENDADKEQLLDSIVQRVDRALDGPNDDAHSRLVDFLRENDLPDPEASLGQMVGNLPTADAFDILLPTLQQAVIAETGPHDPQPTEDAALRALAETLNANDAKLAQELAALTQSFEFEIDRLENQALPSQTVLNIYTVINSRRVQRENITAQRQPNDFAWSRDFLKTGRGVLDLARAARPFLSEPDRKNLDNFLEVADAGLTVFEGATRIMMGDYLGGSTALLKGGAALMGVNMPDPEQQRFEALTNAIAGLDRKIDGVYMAVMDNRRLIESNAALIQENIKITSAGFDYMAEYLRHIAEQNKVLRETIQDGLQAVIENQIDVANQIIQGLSDQLRQYFSVVSDQLAEMERRSAERYQRVHEAILENRLAINRNYWSRIQWIQDSTILDYRELDYQVDALTDQWRRYGFRNHNGQLFRDVAIRAADITASCNVAALDICTNANFAFPQKISLDRHSSDGFATDENTRAILRDLERTDGWKFRWYALDRLLNFASQQTLLWQSRLFEQNPFVRKMYRENGGHGDMSYFRFKPSDSMSISDALASTTLTIDNFSYQPDVRQAVLVERLLQTYTRDSSGDDVLQYAINNRSATFARQPFNPMFVMTGLRIYQQLHVFLAAEHRPSGDRNIQIMRLIQRSQPDWERIAGARCIELVAKLPFLIKEVLTLITGSTLGADFSEGRRVFRFLAEHGNQHHDGQIGWLRDYNTNWPTSDGLYPRDEIRIKYYIALLYRNLFSDINILPIKRLFEILCEINLQNGNAKNELMDLVLSEYDIVNQYSKAFTSLDDDTVRLMRRLQDQGHLPDEQFERTETAVARAFRQALGWDIYNQITDFNGFTQVVTSGSRMHGMQSIDLLLPMAIDVNEFSAALALTGLWQTVYSQD